MSKTKRCALVAILLSLSGTSAADDARGIVFHDQNGNGMFDDAEPGPVGVSVSTGREVVANDAGGHSALPVTDDTILFVIKPHGWNTVLDAKRISRVYYTHKPVDIELSNEI